jgi:RHS repeat-associated protein
MNTQISKILPSKALWMLIVLFFSANVIAQSPNSSDFKIDKNLRSSARVNPATLAMEFSLPLASYPGRDGNSVPVAFGYSSKVWSLKRWQFWHNELGGTGTQINPFLVTNITEYMPMFGKDSFGGWTSGLRALQIAPDEDSYLVDGGPTNNLTNNATETWDCSLDSSTSVIDAACFGGYRIHEEWVCTLETLTGNNDHTLDIDYCPFGPAGGGVGPGGGGPGGGGPDGGGIIWIPGSGEEQIHPQGVTYPDFRVNQFRVNLPDGTTRTFRKDDKVYDCNDYQQCLAAYSRSGSFISIDGSGSRLVTQLDSNNQPTMTLYNPDGSRWVASTTGGVQQYFDKNGNRMTYNASTLTWTDTKGKEIVNPLSVDSVTAGIHAFQLPGMDGQNPQSFSQKWSNLKPAGCSTGTESACDNGALENPTDELSSEGTDACGLRYQDQASTLSPLFPVEAPRTNTEIDQASQWSTVTTKERTCGADTFNPVLLTEVSYPDGSKYKFRYNTYGELTKIIYPTGAYERFRYDTVQPMTYLGYPIERANRGVVERWLSEDGQNVSQHWTYGISGGVSVQTNQDNSRTETTYVVGSSPFGLENPLDGQVAEIRSFDHNGTLKARVLNHYDVTPARTGGDVNATRDARISKSVSIVIENSKALASLTTTDYDVSGSSDPEFFSDLNAKRKTDFGFVPISLSDATANDLSWDTIDHWFSGATPSKVAEADYTYDANYKARGILGLPTETRLMDPAHPNDPNFALSKTQTVYDNAVPASSASYTYPIQSYSADNSMDCSSDPQVPKVCWQNPNGSSGNIDLSYRGLPSTTRTLYAEGGGAWIESHIQYDQFGNAVKVRDPIGNETSTVFGAQYKYAFPTIVTGPAPDPQNTGHGTNLTSSVITSYDFTTGLPLSVTDDFGQVSTTQYDTALRPIFVNPVVVNNSPTGPVTQTIYGQPNTEGQFDADHRFVTVRKQLDANNWSESTTWFDGLGRTAKTQSKDSQGDVFVEKHYDSMGRANRTTNPYRSSDTRYWSMTRFDPAGRAVETYAPAGESDVESAEESNNYSSLTSLGTTSFDISSAGDVGTVITTSDASGRKSRSITNALGQLIRVDEPSGISSDPNADLGNLAQPIQPTYYKYDAYGKMVQVTQGVQNRYFKYDSFGRLLRVNQPEQEVNSPSLDLSDSFNASGHWTAGFAYDILGNVVRATDANGVNIVNEYDRANRVTKRCYTKPNVLTSATTCAQISSTDLSTDTPTVEFWYDGKGLTSPQSPNYAKGKLTKIDNGISSTEYMTFDNFGRLTRTKQITGDTEYGGGDDPSHWMTYSYNLSGALVQETYPSGRIVKNDFESDGDLSRIYGKVNANAAERTYANSFSYMPDGRIEKLRLGSGLWEEAKFNARLQVTELGLGHGVSSPDLWKLNYDYGEINGNNDVDTTKNTGNIARQTLSFSGLAQPFVQSYKYDSLYRLTEARETAGAGTSAPQNWRETFGYDQYGNRTSHSKFNGTTQFAPSNITDLSINPLNNRFNDNQGYGYDKNGNLITDAESRGFTFNADNKQSKVTQNGNTVGEYFYDGEGNRVKKLVHDTNDPDVITEETVFVYSGGKLVAEYSTKEPPSAPTTSYTATDQLGSPRVITNSTGDVVSRRDFMPFGEEVAPVDSARAASAVYISGDNIRQKFTGYQKDEETQLDFAEARMYENRHGRFTAVDPLLASGKSGNPQSFNRYVYVFDNPLILKDSNGLQVDCDPSQPFEETEVLHIDTYWNGAKNVFGTFDDWLASILNKGGNFAQGVRFYSYTTGGDESARNGQVTGQLQNIFNPTTAPSFQTFNRNMNNLNEKVIQRTPFISSLVNAQIAADKGNYGEATFEMGMFELDLVTSVDGGAGNSRALAKNMIKDGVERPLNTAAHHIVAIGDERAAVARALLEKAGVHIDEAANGVFLPRFRKFVEDAGNIAHSELHTDKYYEEITSRLRNSQNIRETLVQIRNEILAGTFPY